MALRAFKAAFYVSIDEAAAKEMGDRQLGLTRVDVDEVRRYPAKSSIIDRQEGDGNPCGVQSMEVEWDGLDELTPDAVERRYGTKLKPYTVVGVYVELGQRFCEHVRAFGPADAEARCRVKPAAADDLIVTGVFEGHLNPVTEG